MQNLEHGLRSGPKGVGSKNEIEALLRKTGNPWHITAKDVEKDLYATNFTRLDGFKRIVITTAAFRCSRNHWNPEEPMKSIEVFVANEYRTKNANAGYSAD